MSVTIPSGIAHPILQPQLFRFVLVLFIMSKQMFADLQIKTIMDMCPSISNELGFAVKPACAPYGFCCDMHNSFSVLQQSVL